MPVEGDPPISTLHELTRPTTMVLDRFSYPRLVGLALVGFGWWATGLLLGIYGPDSLGAVSSVTHLLGLATLVGCGVAYGLLWWSNYLRTRFGV